MRAQPDIGLLKKDPFLNGSFFGQKLSVNRQKTANCHFLTILDKTPYSTHLIVYIVFIIYFSIWHDRCIIRGEETRFVQDSSFPDHRIYGQGSLSPPVT